MPCIPEARLLTPQRRAQIEEALERLRAALAAGTVTAKVGPTGALAFAGWRDNAGLSDVCAYRKLLAANSPELRRAIARAEVTAGRKLDARQVAAGVHSHDGGATWHRGH